ncbi:MAG: sigma 54-interacting transcriptional regulator [Deltaproteobacteria bacterium]|nr:sigma 54-interacting transcriptional regulator [Deltaproteobacteria bacterium]
MIHLEIVQGSEQGRVFDLAQPQVSIGRANCNHVVLPDYHLSGEHGQLFLEDDQFIYRDLRSTNGSSIERGERRIVVDASCQYEITIHDGDRLLLGDPASPVVLAVRLHPGPATSLDGERDRVVASRALAELPQVAGKIEKDPNGALALYHAAKRLSGPLELADTLEAVMESVFEIVPRATHVAIFMRSEADEERFTVAGSRERNRTQPTASSHPVHASRAVLRRVLSQRAAVLVANAAEELGGSESIMGGRIMSTLAVPLWHGDKLRGVIQADNRASAGMFREQDLEMMMVLGAQAALAIENALLVSRLRVAEERLRGENRYLKHREERRRFANIIGNAPTMRAVFSQLEKVIDTRATVCIEGETGTGKELVASAIHYQGKRREKLFVPQNCAAVPENLLESELFGHKKGAFTGADHDKKGLFELADGGTLFLDEIGEMSLGLQAKLLRALQEGMIRPVGSPQERQVDVRIICATNRNLAAEVEKGAFRQDLFYRLMVFPIRLPPLRERREDIPLLCEHFFRRYTQEYRKSVAGFSKAALDALCGYAWPGNIRELENEVQRLVIQSDPDVFIEPEHLSPQVRKVGGTLARIAPKKGTLKDMVDEVERWLLQEALREHGGNKTKTAETLGITREGLHKKLAKFGL